MQVEVPPNTSSGSRAPRARERLRRFLPPHVAVRVSPDGLAWTTVATSAGITATEGVPVVITFAAAQLRFVEVRATRLAQHGSGLYYAALAEVEVLTASPAPGAVVASWTAPADDGPTGRAAHYDLRMGVWSRSTRQPRPPWPPPFPPPPERPSASGPRASPAAPPARPSPPPMTRATYPPCRTSRPSWSRSAGGRPGGTRGWHSPRRDPYCHQVRRSRVREAHPGVARMICASRRSWSWIAK